MEMVAVENGYSNDKGIDGRTACATYCSSGRQDGDMLPHDDCGYPRYNTYCTSVLEANAVPYTAVKWILLAGSGPTMPRPSLALSSEHGLH
jgi:hypothetical protein